MQSCAHAQKKKSQKSPNLSPLADLEAVHKQKMKAKIEL